MNDVNTILQDSIWNNLDSVVKAEQYYIDNAGNVEEISNSQYDEHILTLLANSFTSPVQEITTINDASYYGVIDYKEGDEWYGFIANDRTQTKRVIGVREINGDSTITSEAELPHVTAGDPTGSFTDNPGASYQQLANALDEYYTEEYGENRDTVSNVGPPDHAQTKRLPGTGVTEDVLGKEP